MRTEAQLGSRPHQLVADCAQAPVDVLARLHAVEPASVGLDGFGRSKRYLARQVARWRDQWQRVRTRDLPDVETLHTLLAQACMRESGALIVHGDFRIDNAILVHDDPSLVRGLVNWEMATLGDPLADLGLHLVCADPVFAPVLAGRAASTSPRLLVPADLAERYAAASGRSLQNLGYCIALGYLKIAVIAENIHARDRQGLTLGSGFESVGDAPAPLSRGRTVRRRDDSRRARGPAEGLHHGTQSSRHAGPATRTGHGGPLPGVAGLGVPHRKHSSPSTAAWPLKPRFEPAGPDVSGQNGAITRLSFGAAESGDREGMSGSVCSGSYRCEPGEGSLTWGELLP
ncbi:phosphotransferase family protein [Streptomyces sp. NPDC014776]|uniref:phosphotransferase family protein n=1 Tax=unclassified Streptomyces TaxID=2593676 RepID=UPI003702CE67